MTDPKTPAPEPTYAPGGLIQPATTPVRLDPAECVVDRRGGCIRPDHRHDQEPTDPA